MLKRTDIAKEFSLVVQQEINNHNKNILETNVSINNLRDQVIENDKKHNAIETHLSTEISRTNCNLKNLSDMVLKNSEQLLNHIRENKKNHSSQNLNYSECLDNVQALISKNEDLSDVVASLRTDQECLNNHMVDMGLQYARSLGEQFIKFDALVKGIKKEILERPSEAQQVKKEIESRLNTRDVDIQGLYEEANIIKKSLFILEKNIENLYTLIERLNKKIGG